MLSFTGLFNENSKMRAIPNFVGIMAPGPFNKCIWQNGTLFLLCFLHMIFIFGIHVGK